MFKRLLMVAMLVIAPLTAARRQISPIRIS
jgi:hypothetical protein